MFINTVALYVCSLELCSHSSNCEVFGPLVFYRIVRLTLQKRVSIISEGSLALSLQSTIVKAYYAGFVWKSDVLKPFCEQIIGSFVEKNLFFLFVRYSSPCK